MSLVDWVLILLIAGVCGSLAQALAGYSHGGCLVSVVLGFIGALLGTWLAELMHLPDLFVLRIDGRPFPVIWSIIGGALFAALLQIGRRRR